MSSEDPNYHELDELDATFLELLRAEESTPSPVATFWHEAISRGQDAEGTPTIVSRGPAALRFFRESKLVGKLESLYSALPKDRWPETVCRRVLARGAGKSSGPYRVTFRYDEITPRVWQGGYSVESYSERDALVGERRAVINPRILEFMKSQWTADTMELGFQYGLQQWDEPGPRYRVHEVKDGRSRTSGCHVPRS